jgi:thioredoxin reductase (NADPH)
VSGIDVDLLIVGAGPSGLYGAYYAGFRGLSTAIVDGLPEAGGQVTALYPEKQIFDVAGFPTIKGKDVVVVGGGDSALDWALGLEPVARSVTLVHRRDAFRAHAHSVKLLRDSTVSLCIPAQVVGISGGDRVEAVSVRNTETKQVTELPAQEVVAALGFTADITPLEAWGLNVEERHIVVDTTMATNLPRVFAAGDITEYAGKVRLISVGFGEVATAVCNAATVIDPEATVFPGHSTEQQGEGPAA